MPDLGGELHFGWLVWIVGRDHYIYLVDALLIDRVVRPIDVCLPPSEVIINQSDPNAVLVVLGGQVLVFLLDPFISHIL